MARRLKMVEVEWRDSTRTGGWAKETEYRGTKPLTCRTAGYLFERTRDHIGILQSMDGQDDRRVTDLMTIPLENVKRVRILVPRGERGRMMAKKSKKKGGCR